MTYGPVPGNRLTWDAYAGSAEFVSYNWARRERRSIVDFREQVVNVYSDPRVLIQPVGMFDGYRGALALRASFPWNNASEPGGGSGTPTILYWWDDDDNFMWLYYNNATNAFIFTREAAGVSNSVTVAASITIDLAFTLAIYWTPTGIGMSVNGAAFVIDASAPGAAIEAPLFDIGTKQGAEDSSVAVTWMIAFAGVLTDADAATIHALAADEFGDWPPSFEPLRALPDDALPSGLWDGVETYAYRVEVAPWRSGAIYIEDVNYYTDRAVASGQVYEYTVTVSETNFGEVLTSEPQHPPITASVTFEGVSIHNVRDMSDYCIVQVTAIHVQPEQEIAWVHARGRQQPTAQFGELESSRIAFTPLPYLPAETQDWGVLRRFLTKQRTEGAIFMVRPGNEPTRYFAHVERLDRESAGVLSQVQIEMREAFYEEST